MKSCWESEEILEEMKRSKKSLPPLNEQPHGIVLLNHLQFVKSQLACMRVVDVGCGLTTLSDYVDNYVGVDNVNVVTKLLLQSTKSIELIGVDIDENTDFSIFLNEGNCIVMNGFIDVMEKPIEILSRILMISKDFVILHRQHVRKNKPTEIIENPSYGAMTKHSMINEAELYALFNKFNYTVINVSFCGFNNWENGGHSFLLRRKYD